MNVLKKNSWYAEKKISIKLFGLVYFNVIFVSNDTYNLLEAFPFK